MAAPVVWFRGGEDDQMAPFGASSVITTAGSFRATYARSSLSTLNDQPSSWINIAPIAASGRIYYAARMWGSQNSQLAANQGTALTSMILWRARNSNSYVKLRIRLNAAFGTPAVLLVEKVTNAGVATTLGSAFTFIQPGTTTARIVVEVNYTSTGWVKVYNNKSLIFDSGVLDVTTDSDTVLGFFEWGALYNQTVLAYSELIVTDTDPRAWSLQIFPPVANGNTHNFDTGSPAAANVNEVTLSEATMDASTTAGQIDQYTTGAVVSGVYGIIEYSIVADAQGGSSGPSKINLGVRTAGSDFFPADQVVAMSFMPVVYGWQVNPNTTNPWAPTEIGATSGFNIGAKSVT